MRDGNILQMNQQMEKKFAAMYKQIQFLDCRQQAIELALRDFWSVFYFVFARKAFWKNVDLLQVGLLRKHDEKIHEMIKQKKEEAMKPKLTLPPNVISNGAKLAVMVVCLFTLLPSCVSKKVYKKDIDNAYAQGYEGAKFECDKQLNTQSKYITSLVERLKKFNQVDEHGNLYEPKPKWPGKAGGSDDVKGNESWLK